MQTIHDITSAAEFLAFTMGQEEYGLDINSIDERMLILVDIDKLLAFDCREQNPLAA